MTDDVTQRKTVLRITCENPEQCQRLAEVQEEFLATFVVYGVVVCVTIAIAVTIYQVHSGDPDAE